MTTLYEVRLTFVLRETIRCQSFFTTLRPTRQIVSSYLKLQGVYQNGIDRNNFKPGRCYDYKGLYFEVIKHEDSLYELPRCNRNKDARKPKMLKLPAQKRGRKTRGREANLSKNNVAKAKEVQDRHYRHTNFRRSDY